MGDKKQPSKDGPGRGGQTVLERKAKTKQPRLFRVILHNDDYTTMEFVVWVLKGIFRKSESEAVGLMLNIHQKGQGIAGVYARDIAETKTAQVETLAEEHQMPLLCTCEPED